MLNLECCLRVWNTILSRALIGVTGWALSASLLTGCAYFGDYVPVNSNPIALAELPATPTELPAPSQAPIAEPSETPTDSVVDSQSNTASGGSEAESKPKPKPKPKPVATPVPSPKPTEPPNPVFDNSAEIDIDDQRGDGRFIEIDEVEVGLGQSWLVIFNESGDIVASALVSPSVEPVSVLIISRLTNSQTLTAYLYLDDGDGVFDRFDDPLIRESPEKSLQEEFDYRVRD